VPADEFKDIANLIMSSAKVGATEKKEEEEPSASSSDSEQEVYKIVKKKKKKQKKQQEKKFREMPKRKATDSPVKIKQAKRKITPIVKQLDS